MSWDANGSPVEDDKKRCCYECKATHSEQWFDYTITVDDPYGMECSEPELGVPTTMEMDIDICKSCQDKADKADEEFEAMHQHVFGGS